MRPFKFIRAGEADAAVQAYGVASSGAETGAANSSTQYLAGGTTLQAGWKYHRVPGL